MAFMSSVGTRAPMLKKSESLNPGSIRETALRP